MATLAPATPAPDSSEGPLLIVILVVVVVGGVVMFGLIAFCCKRGIKRTSAAGREQALRQKRKQMIKDGLLDASRFTKQGDPIDSKSEAETDDSDEGSEGGKKKKKKKKKKEKKAKSDAESTEGESTDGDDRDSVGGSSKRSKRSKSKDNSSTGSRGSTKKKLLDDDEDDDNDGVLGEDDDFMTGNRSIALDNASALSGSSRQLGRVRSQSRIEVVTPVSALSTPAGSAVLSTSYDPIFGNFDADIDDEEQEALEAYYSRLEANRDNSRTRPVGRSQVVTKPVRKVPLDDRWVPPLPPEKELEMRLLRSDAEDEYNRTMFLAHGNKQKAAPLPLLPYISPLIVSAPQRPLAELETLHIPTTGEVVERAARLHREPPVPHRIVEVHPAEYMKTVTEWL